MEPKNMTARPSTPPVNALGDPSAVRLSQGDLEAVFLPGHGMLGISLRHRGSEILRRLDDLPSAARKGSTAGIPLLYPWANRLSGLRYQAAGRTVALDPASPLLHFDGNGLPMHGVPWAQLAWQVNDERPDRLEAGFDWSRDDLLALYPFRHRLALAIELQDGALMVETILVAGDDGPVPVSFGFHPYIGLPGLPRVRWDLHLPAMRRLRLDDNGIPTGEADEFGGLDDELGHRDFDDGFALIDLPASFSISGAGRTVTVEMLAGFRYAQVFAPKDQELIAFEPMTAPSNALVSGDGLRLVRPGGTFRSSFRIVVASA